MSWKEVEMFEIVRRLGLPTGRRGLPCPACGRERRDRRGAVGMRRDLRGWRCFCCGVGGFPLDYAAWQQEGGAYLRLSREARGRVRAWAAAEGMMEAAPARPALIPLLRPPSAQVEALWGACLPVTSCLLDGEIPDPDAEGFLRRRGLLPLLGQIVAADLARLTPPRSWARWPEWWPAGRARLWRLIVRAFEPDGRPGSLHARAVVDRPSRDGEALPRQLWPRRSAGLSLDAAGLFFADPAAQDLLAGRRTCVSRLLICEGLTDWLAAAAHAQRIPGLAVLGGVSGSFPALARVRWPSPMPEVIAAVDADEAGERYLAQIRDALPGCPLRRLRLGAP